MVAPAVAAGIAAAALAASGGVAGQSRKKTPMRQLRTYPETREAQLYSLLQAQRQGLGQGPSYAELQMQRAGEQARALQSSNVASARGANIALAQRTGAQQQAAIGADIAQQAGAARIEEIMAARQLAAQQAEAIRAQDLQQEQINLQARIARDQAEFARRQANKARLYGALTMGAAALGRAGAGGGGAA